MARVPEITIREDVPEAKRPIFDAIAESRGRVGGPFAVLLNSPEVAGRAAHLGAYLRFESVLSPVQRELATLTAAREANCDYEWAAHTRLGRQAGVREEAIEAIANRAGLDGLTPEESAIVRYGRELLRAHRVSDETFEAARGRFGDQGVTDLTAMLGYYTMIACALNAFGVEPAPGSARLP